MNKKRVAEELTMAARELVVAERLLEAQPEDQQEEIVDEAFAKVVRDLRSKMSKLTSQKNKRLSRFGIEVIRPNSTVEDLVSALNKVLAGV